MTLEQYPKQFVLSADPDALPVRWPTRTLGGWHLAAHPRLPVAEIVTASGKVLGWILGYPVTADTYCANRFTVPEGAVADRRVVERVLRDVAGRHLAIVCTAGYSHVYPDACASLSAVYSTRHQVLASTPGLIDSEQHPVDEDLVRALGMPQSGLWFPFGLTPRQHVRRLLPNHALDLTQWTAVRTWTPPVVLQRDSAPEEAVAEFASRVRATLSTIAKHRPLHLSLTAGRDSRLLLACARPVLDRVVFFTFKGPNQSLDAYMADRISSRLGLDHLMLRVEMADEQERAAWQELVGGCVSGEIWRIHPTQRHLHPERVVCPGMVGGLGRGLYWRQGDGAGPLAADDIVRRCGLPVAPAILAAADAWLAPLTDADRWAMLDLLYLEQRTGCWGAPQTYGAEGYVHSLVFPLADARIVRLLMRLPLEYRLRGRLFEDACRESWPEVLEWPFNSFMGVRRYSQWARRVSRRVVGAAVRRVARVVRPTLTH